ncbi:MAG: helix-hairpin-helix domain-containing protein [Bacteroidetes bacterium]|nr:helix-hairpin-helix domain-containing protein [Bacteroidota bacterium]
MGPLQRLQDFFAFTKNEQKVFLFLAVVFLAGAGVKGYRAYIDPPQRTPFGYAAHDTVFFARSAAAETDTAATEQPPAKVELNSATKEQLMTLPGIGEAMAERIMLRRQELGRFRRADELRSVKGIGAKKLEKLTPHIEVK